MAYLKMSVLLKFAKCSNDPVLTYALTEREYLKLKANEPSVGYYVFEKIGDAIASSPLERFRCNIICCGNKITVRGIDCKNKDNPVGVIYTQNNQLLIDRALPKDKIAFYLGTFICSLWKAKVTSSNFTWLSEIIVGDKKCGIDNRVIEKHSYETLISSVANELENMWRRWADKLSEEEMTLLAKDISEAEHKISKQ